MSNKKPSTKQKSTTTNSGAKQSVGRPRKNTQIVDPRLVPEPKLRKNPSSKRKIAEYNSITAPKVRADKARIVAVTNDSPVKQEMEAFNRSSARLDGVVAKHGVPKSVQKLATAKTLAPKRPLSRPAVKKPAVDVAQLQKSLRNAEVAKAANEKVVKKLESELKGARAENRVLRRTVERLQSVIDELKAEKAVRGSWLRRLLRRG